MPSFTFSDGLLDGQTTSLTTVTVTATFSSEVNNVVALDFGLAGAIAVGEVGGSGDTWTLVLTLGSAASVTVDMAAESNAISPANAAAQQATLVYGEL